MIDFSGIDKQERISSLRNHLDYLNQDISEKCAKYDIDESLVKSGNYKHGLESPLSYHEQLEIMSKQYVLTTEKLRTLEE